MDHMGEAGDHSTKLIVLHTNHWKTVIDFYDALLTALGAPESHGRNINAFIDSIVYGNMNAIEAPFTVRIVGYSRLSPSLVSEVELLRSEISRPNVDVDWEFVL